MSFTIRGICQHGELLHRRRTSDAAVRKAREMISNGCYDIHIITPEGRDYVPSEFGDIPRARIAGHSLSKSLAGSMTVTGRGR